jgi:thioredoxin-dependent peroxiredoxin
MIEAGWPAPDFEAPDSTGRTFKLSALRGRKVILYFFPKAFTGGCTRETREFALLAPSLAEKGSQVVGVSTDSAETQARFAAHCSAGFPIVSDSTKSIARAYGVLAFLGFSKRVTFFIDEKGIVRDTVVGVLPAAHVARAREVLK